MVDSKGQNFPFKKENEKADSGTSKNIEIVSKRYGKPPSFRKEKKSYFVK